MKIEKSAAVTFEDVKVGQVFEWDGKVFIKGYDSTESGKYMIIDLNSGYATRPLTDTSEVILHENAKVVIE